ncbi:MAG TPA: hypothetical protein VMC78_14660 [Mycobacterium sp.]|nr:hypothetical protein [Mycobacterium sp.]
MTPGPAGAEDEDALVALRLVLVALDDDTEAESRNDAISVIADAVGPSAEHWRVIALDAARLAALFATSIYGPPGSEEARVKARTAVQKLLVGALDRRNNPG